MHKIKKAYERTRIKTNTPKERKTKAVQSEKHSSDVNNIVAKAYKTGQLPTLMQRQPIEQLPDVETYQDALNKVVFAQQSFERLPSGIRQQFDNDPKKLLSAMKDPEMKSTLQEFGIVNPDPETPPEPPAPPEKVVTETPKIEV